MNNLYRNKPSSEALKFTQDSDRELHVITTDNIRFANLGLSSFTTGVLYDWMFATDQGIYRKSFETLDNKESEIRSNPRARDGAAERYLISELSPYNNLKQFVHQYSRDVFGFDNQINGYWPTEIIFDGRAASSVDENCNREALEYNYYFNGWRNEGRNGEYKLFKNFHYSDAWKYEENGGNTYTWNQLRLEDFDKINITGATLDDLTPTVFPLCKSGEGNIIHRIIELNNYVNLLQHRSIEEWSVRDKARAAFIRDIKTSREGCLRWTSNVRFLLDIPRNLIEASIPPCSSCTKEVNVEFKLYLYDDMSNRKQTGRTIVSSNTLHALPKTTGYGREFTEKDESGHTPPSVNGGPKNATVGQISTTWNSLEGKFESGTTQILAIMLDDLEGAEQPNLTDMLEKDEKYLLGTTTGLGPKIGKAVTLSMQNSNPRQWMPDFEKSKQCRESDNSKVVLDIVNPTTRSFRKGENVMLQKINGVWVPLSVGDGDVSISPADPKWDFTYLMTNSHFFFRSKNGEDTPTKISPQQYEQSFYNAYYSEIEDDGSILIPNNSGRYATSEFADVYNGYFQVTSWDFMGVNIGGTRRLNHSEGYKSYITEEQALAETGFANADNGNALSNTQALFDTKNNDFNGDDVTLNSYPFFGCVFPEGYTATAEYTDLMNTGRDFYLSVKDAIDTGNLPLPPFHFPTNKAVFKNINNVRNILDASEDQNKQQDQGMFPEGEAGTLKHLPADIATNASPSGIYGRPISSIGLIGKINDYIVVGGVSSGIRSAVETYFQKNENTSQPNRYSWMYKKDISKIGTIITDENAGDFAYGYEDSAFDLQPADPMHIEFRPLSAEVYASMEGWEWNWDDNTIERQYYFTNDPYKRGELSLEASQFTVNGVASYSPPLSSLAVARNKHVSPGGASSNLHNLYNIAQANDDPYPGQIIIDNVIPTPVYNNHGLRYKPDLIQAFDRTLPDLVGGFPSNWWDDPWYGGGVPDVTASLGGVGIIGAVVTVATLDALQFTTDNRIGLDDQFNSAQEWEPSWKAGDFSAQNTINLYMKVYQQWPRELTIYDPRFFVVHHFNDGVDIQSKDIEQDLFNNGENQGPAAGDIAQDYPNGQYLVDRKESKVDFRVPTNWDNNLITSGYVYGDSIDGGLKSSDAIDNGVTRLRQKEHWRINKQSRGKLLPYSYKFYSIMISRDPVIRLAVAGDGPYKASEIDILITNPGIGYGEADRFKVSGSIGGGVVLKPFLDDEGRVLGFTVESTGLGFSVQDFLDSDATLYWDAGSNPPTANTSIVIGSSGSKGSGFEGYILRGEVNQTDVITDLKPLQALDRTGEIRLSPDKTLDSQGQDLQLKGPLAQSFSINPDARTENYQYDVFLLFHNDITQTRFTNAGSSPLHAEQYIRLKILGNTGTTTLSAEKSDSVSDIVLDRSELNQFGQASWIRDNQLADLVNGVSDMPGGGSIAAGFGAIGGYQMQ
jgi:hypothetical protein